MGEVNLPADLVSEIRDIKRRIKDIELGPSLRNTSMRDGTMIIADSDGNPKVRIGMQPDGRLATVVILDDTGTERAALGELVDGSYGVGVLNDSGQLVSLNAFVFGQRYDEVITSESTNSTTSVDLATVGPEVTVVVGETGRVLVTAGAYIGINAGLAVTGTVGLFIDGVGISNIIGLSDGGTSGLAASVQNSREVTLLTPGAHTFSLRYRSSNSGSAINFSSRTLLVQPL